MVEPRVTASHTATMREVRWVGAGACVNKIKIHCQYELESCNQGFDTHLSFSTFLKLGVIAIRQKEIQHVVGPVSFYRSTIAR